MRTVWGLAALAAFPALVAAVVSVGVDWTPASDWAPIEVRVRDVFSANPPLVGVFSRVGGNHPGPALFYVLAFPYRLLGSEPWALFVGPALVNAACCALATRIVGRGGRAGLAAWFVALTLACTWGLGVDHVRDPWNPSMAVFPFLLAAVAAWAVSCGSRRSLPVALAAASFSLQAHVGYLLLVAVLVVWCVISVWQHRGEWRAWGIPVALSGAGLALMWSPAIVQQLWGDDPGNLTAIVSAARASSEPAYGLTGVDNLLLPHLGPTPSWFRPDPDDALLLGGRQGLTWPPLGLVAFVAGTVVAVRRQDREPLILLVLTAALWGAGAVSISQLSGVPAPYLYLWVRVLGILLWLAALWPLGRALVVAGRRRESPASRDGALGAVAWVRRPAVQQAAVAAAVAVLAVVVAAGETATPFRRYRDEFAQTAILSDRSLAAVRRQAPPGSRVEVTSMAENVFVYPAVVADLERAGFHALVQAGDVWGSHRLAGRTRPDVRLVLAGDPEAAQAADAGLRRVTTVDMLTPEERREYTILEPLERRCAAIYATAWSAPSSSSTPDERESCTRRSELARSDRQVSVLIGPAAG
jgi:hypothetical protein